MAVTLEVIAERLQNLAETTAKGFKGIHERQDKTNGNVKLNTEWRLKNLKPVGFLWTGITIAMTAIVMGGINLLLK